MIATQSAPAAIASDALSSVMPPIATSGTPSDARLAEQGQRRAGRTRFRLRSEHAAEGDMIGACGNRRARGIQARIARYPEQFPRQQAACSCDFAVVPADVRAVGIDRGGQRHIVIDDQRYSPAPG